MVDYHQPQPALSLRHGDICGVPGCHTVQNPLQHNGWWCADSDDSDSDSVEIKTKKKLFL